MVHTVIIPALDDNGRTRARCSCGWFSPVVTNRPGWPDAPRRAGVDVVELARKAAEWHVRQRVSTPVSAG
jgi:hypothetical protein